MQPKWLTASAIWLSQHREHWFLFIFIFYFSIWELDKCVAKGAYDDDYLDNEIMTKKIRPFDLTAWSPSSKEREREFWIAQQRLISGSLDSLLVILISYIVLIKIEIVIIEAYKNYRKEKRTGAFQGRVFNQYFKLSSCPVHGNFMCMLTTISYYHHFFELKKKWQSFLSYIEKIHTI